MKEYTNIVGSALAAAIRLQQTFSKYLSVPRSYGTEDVLFMREAHLLEALGDSGKMMSAEELAAALDITHGAVTQLTQRLEKKGYVYRDKSQMDRRQILRGLTEKGRQVYALHRSYDQRQFQSILEKCGELTEEEYRTFIKVADYLSACIRQDG